MESILCHSSKCGGPSPSSLCKLTAISCWNNDFHLATKVKQWLTPRWVTACGYYKHGCEGCLKDCSSKLEIEESSPNSSPIYNIHLQTDTIGKHMKSLLPLDMG